MSRYMDIGSKRKAHNQSQFYRVMNLSIMTPKTVCLIMSRVGITVYGYADPTPASWRFQIDDEAPQELVLQSDARLCRAIKDRQDLKAGNHRVTLTPFTTSFVLTKFRYVYFKLVFQNPVTIYSNQCHNGQSPRKAPKVGNRKNCRNCNWSCICSVAPGGIIFRLQEMLTVNWSVTKF